MTLFKESGELHEGFYKDDKLHGFGRAIFQSGGYFIGEFADGSILYGKEVNINGNEYTG